MGRKRREDEPTSYEPQTEVPAELTQRHEIVLAVIRGEKTITAAAAELGIARVNMQTLVHRAQAAMIASLAPKATGPVPTPARERELAAELKRLQKENAKLQEQLYAADQMMGAAGEIIRSLRGLPPESSSRSSTRSSRTRKKPGPSDEEPEPASSRLPSSTITTAVAAMPERGARAARALGVRYATLRRWLGRVALGEPVLRRRGGRRAHVGTNQQVAVRVHVRALGGLVGAVSLARTVAGVSRRAAADLKRDELAAIERERQAACSRVAVSVPGAIRGFDAMHLEEGYALIAADAAVPFRTSVVHVLTYDAAHVARVLEADFSEHGPPLALRHDRASCHDAPAVLSVLRRFGVQSLHGPPRHPGYYGQLERQNREHRGWLEAADAVRPDLLLTMKAALNDLWRRPTLDWRTAAEVWHSRPALADDRKELDDDVQQRAAHLRERGLASDMAMRLAIEQALIERGYLRITTGQKLLCE